MIGGLPGAPAFEPTGAQRFRVLKRGVFDTRLIVMILYISPAGSP